MRTYVNSLNFSAMQEHDKRLRIDTGAKLDLTGKDWQIVLYPIGGAVELKRRPSSPSKAKDRARG